MSRMSLEDRLRCDAALDEAFEPLRARGTHVSPARVRAKVRWGLAETPPRGALRWSGRLGRLSELGAAVGMSALMFVATLGGALEDASPAAAVMSEGAPEPLVQQVRVSEPLEGTRFIRWLRLGRELPMNDRLDPTIPLAVESDLSEPQPQIVLRDGTVLR